MLLENFREIYVFGNFEHLCLTNYSLKVKLIQFHIKNTSRYLQGHLILRGRL